MEQVFISTAFVRTTQIIRMVLLRSLNAPLLQENPSLTHGELRNMDLHGTTLTSLFKVCCVSTLVLLLFTNSKSAYEGVLGGIIINGPATANYDEDAGVLFLNDWSHETADALYETAQTSGPPTLDNGLINGTNVYGDLGSRFETTFVSGTSYRIRLVNSAIDTMFKFMIDNHTMTVIATDLVPIVPYETTVLSIGIGQRYDIIVTADQSTADYWLRAIPQTSCSDTDNAGNIKGIVRYDSTSTSDPTSSAYDYIDSCNDEDMGNLVPYVPLNASTAGVTDDFAVTVGRSGSVFKWFMAGTTFVVSLLSITLLTKKSDAYYSLG